MKLRYTPAAMLDLQEIHEYIRDVLLNPDAADHVIVGIASSCTKLKEHPHIGTPLQSKFRREIDGYCIITGKYIVIYDIDDAVSVIRILDTHTDYLRILLADPP